jgi:F-type H+-transporting ATPase subunit c
MMKRLPPIVLALLAVCATASAQGAANPPAPVNLGPVCAAFGMTIASSLCGLAQGKAIASAVESIARNPGAARAIQLAMLIGLAFVESLALYTLLVVFIFGH